ncbi:MAG: phosphoenolpyruvate carboxykinase (ATP) [Deltaproteobacteria bacterium]|nr:phosphoenolpyruvate carboxykinase (ATP) [Deltaproteobacteria bacterium]
MAVATQGHRPESEFNNPSDAWLVSKMRIFQDLPSEAQAQVLAEWRQIYREAEAANARGKAGRRAGPDIVYRLPNGGLAFFSQLGVVRRPDLTQYFIEGFPRNRDAIAFSEETQALFAEVFPHITRYLRAKFAAGDTVIQTDRQIGDAPGRSFHARQLFFGTRYLQVPALWRELTFDLPAARRREAPDILEVSIPNWLEELDLREELKTRIREAGLIQLVFKAPTKGLSLHLGFDYLGEHKMGPLTIGMFKVRQAGGLAVQAALSVARVRRIDGTLINTALVTTGPSLHGKSTITIMLELANSPLGTLLGLQQDPQEGVYPMNDDIVLIQRLPAPIEVVRDSKTIKIPYAIDGTENNFYAVPFGLTEEDDPITWAAIQGQPIENAPIDLEKGAPNFFENPVRNMRAIFARQVLVDHKGTRHVLEAMTRGRLNDSVHVPMEAMDSVFWQGVMRRNDVVPPLIRLIPAQYVRALMQGEAVQMGAAVGAIGQPYVEYFSDPFIIGLEDENANRLGEILKAIEEGGLAQEFYMFNTGGVGADTNEQASGARYRKITRDLTLMLEEALLRGAVVFEYDRTLGVDVAVAIVTQRGEVVKDLREWLPREIYGDEEYKARVTELKRRRYYGKDAGDKAGILRYTKVAAALFDFHDLPAPQSERELTWLLSFAWHLDQACSTLAEAQQHLSEGQTPSPEILRELQRLLTAGLGQGLVLAPDRLAIARRLGLIPATGPSEAEERSLRILSD